MQNTLVYQGQNTLVYQGQNTLVYQGQPTTLLNDYRLKLVSFKGKSSSGGKCRPGKGIVCLKLVSSKRNSSQG